MTKGSAAENIHQFLKKLAPGTVFTPAELIQADLGTPTAVRQYLHRQAALGAIRSVAPGYYDIPRIDKAIGKLRPTPEAVVDALRRKTGATIERAPHESLNKLGLSTQVAAKTLYRTNLFSRDIEVGGTKVRLRRSGPRGLQYDTDDVVWQILAAIRKLGPRRLGNARMNQIRDIVKRHRAKRKLLAAKAKAAQWMRGVIDEIASY